jgi:hypothetical protein
VIAVGLTLKTTSIPWWPKSLSEIEKGTRRLLAIRQHDDNTASAARALGMASISLARWIGRRALPERRSAGGPPRGAAR